jgi:hypothetical protein
MVRPGTRALRAASIAPAPPRRWSFLFASPPRLCVFALMFRFLVSWLLNSFRPRITRINANTSKEIDVPRNTPNTRKGSNRPRGSATWRFDRCVIPNRSSLRHLSVVASLRLIQRNAARGKFGRGDEVGLGVAGLSKLCGRLCGGGTHWVEFRAANVSYLVVRFSSYAMRTTRTKAE